MICSTECQHLYFNWPNDFEIHLQGKGFWSYVNGTQPSAAWKVVTKQTEDMASALILMSTAPSCKAAATTCRDPHDV